MRASAFANPVARAGLVAAMLAASISAHGQQDAGFAAAETTDAAALVSRTADDAIAVLRGAQPHAAAELRSQVGEDFNVQYIGLLALGAHAKHLDANALADFDDAFVDYLATRYAALLDIPGDPTVRIEGVQSAGARDTIVLTAIEGRATVVKAEWRVRQFGGRPLVIDVSVEGASLLDTLRADIARWLREDGTDGLIARMQAASGEP